MEALSLFLHSIRLSVLDQKLVAVCISSTIIVVPPKVKEIISNIFVSIFFDTWKNVIIFQTEIFKYLFDMIKKISYKFYNRGHCILHPSLSQMALSLEKEPSFSCATSWSVQHPSEKIKFCSKCSTSCGSSRNDYCHIFVTIYFKIKVTDHFWVSLQIKKF